jgi:SAM-dependent methyltransferase
MFSVKRLVWALRKLRFPIGRNGIVLDVGSGGNPYPRSDVLLDRLGGAEHRSGVAMKIDRLAILGDATKLPFKDKSFDFIIASHILEHMPNPEIFLKEIQRVGKAGYIETPSFLCERLSPCDAHCLEISLVDGALHIHKKGSSIEDSFVANMKFLQTDKDWAHLFHSDPGLFHVKYFWVDKIDWNIVNPEISCEWIENIYSDSVSNEVISSDPPDSRTGWRKFGIVMLEKYHSWQRLRRLKNFDIFSVLACPECKGDLEKKQGSVICEACDISYSSSPFLNFEKNAI